MVGGKSAESLGSVEADVTLEKPARPTDVGRVGEAREGLAHFWKTFRDFVTWLWRTMIKWTITAFAYSWRGVVFCWQAPGRIAAWSWDKVRGLGSRSANALLSLTSFVKPKPLATTTPSPKLKPASPPAPVPAPEPKPVSAAARVPPPMPKPASPASQSPPPMPKPVSPAARVPPPMPKPMRPVALTQPAKPVPQIVTREQVAKTETKALRPAPVPVPIPNPEALLPTAPKSEPTPPPATGTRRDGSENKLTTENGLHKG